MYRFIAITAVIFSFCFSSFSQEINEKETAQFRKTKVSQETLMGYGVDEYGAAKDIGTKKSTRSFDTYGNIKSLIEYNEKSQPVRRYEFKYKRPFTLIGVLEYKGYDELVDRYKLSYNKDGLKEKRTGTLESNKYEIVYKYDAQKKLVSKVKTIKGNSEAYAYDYVYANGRLTEEKYKSPKLSLKKTFEYNDKGELVKEKSSTNELEGYTFEYAYDSLGNKTSEKKYTIDGLPYEWYEYTYTESKEVKSISKYNFRGLLTYKWIYFYNDKDNLDSVKIYESETSELIYITKYLYKYSTRPAVTNSKK